jgi:anti-anti-sigma factor
VSDWQPSLLHDRHVSEREVAAIAVAGKIDLATVDVLHEGLRPVLSAQIPHRIDVDLAGVTFMDCTGLSALVAVRHAAVRTGRQLQVTNPQPIVCRIVELSGLLGILTAAFDHAPPAPTRPASASLSDPLLRRCPGRGRPPGRRLTETPHVAYLSAAGGREG